MKQAKILAIHANVLGVSNTETFFNNFNAHLVFGLNDHHTETFAGFISVFPADWGLQCMKSRTTTWSR